MTKQVITSRKNPLLQQVKKMLTSRKAWEEAGLFVADGTKLLQEAIRWWPGLDTVILSQDVEMEIRPFPDRTDSFGSSYRWPLGAYECGQCAICIMINLVFFFF